MQKDDVQALRWSIRRSPPALPRSPVSQPNYSTAHCPRDGIEGEAAATTQALNAARVALRTMHNEPKAASSYLHKALAATSGAVGGSFGLVALPLAWQVAERAEGNPLFVEEIVSYLTERGMFRTITGKLDFDATALPGSVHSLLTARVDRLAPTDRSLLQAASVIGRRVTFAASYGRGSASSLCQKRPQ
jgi:hypothetical protein